MCGLGLGLGGIDTMVALPFLSRGGGWIGLGWTMRRGAVCAGEGSSFALVSRSSRSLLSAQCRLAGR